MISDVRRLIGNVEVSEDKGLITVSGIPSYAFTNDIKNVWNTIRINNYMFVKATRSELTLYSFFAIEFEIILEKILETPNARTNKRALREILAQLRENTWLAKREQSYPSLLNSIHLKEIKFTLLPHQKEFFELYNNIVPRYNLRGLLLMVPPGGGKTISGISVAVGLQSEITYIVCPNNAVFEVWAKTLANDMTKKQSYWVSREGKPIPQDCKWFIFHYEDLQKAVDLAYLAKDKRSVILLDESHNFNDPSSNRTQLFLQLCKDTKCRNILFASGTPIKALGIEAVTLLKAIDPLFTKAVSERFVKIFGKSANKANDILAHRLGLVSYKVAKTTFMDKEPIIEDKYIKLKNGNEFTLPAVREVMRNFITERMQYYNSRKKQYEETYFGLIKKYYEPTLKTDNQLKEYENYKNTINNFRRFGYDPITGGDNAKFCNYYEREYIEPFIPEKLRKDFREAKTVVKYLELKVRGECLGRILYKERERCIAEIAKNVNYGDIIDGAEKKTLIFTTHVNVVDIASEVLVNEGYKPLKVYAETNSELVPMVKQYREDPDINPMVATYASLSTAVPLIMANTLIMLNSPFRHHEQDQAISRCNRLGQDKQVYVYRFFLDTEGIPNLSTRSEDIFEWSKQQVEQILGVSVPPDADENIALESELGFVNYYDYKPTRPFMASLDW